MNSSSFGGTGDPNSTPHSHFPSKATNGNNAQNNGGDNNNRGRSNTDSALLNFKNSFDATQQLEMSAESTAPYKQRLYELFSLIEREVEALYMENCALRTRLEIQSDGRPANESETPRRRVIADNLPAHHQMNNEIIQNIGHEIEQKLSVGGKKSTQTRQQKWKSAFKNPSGKLALKVGANFPAESKHRFVQTIKGHTDGVWHVCTAQLGTKHVLASASADQTSKIWIADNGAHPVATYSGHAGSVNSVAFRPAYSGLYGSQLTVLSCSGDQSAHIWRANLETILEKRRDKAGGGQQSHENEDDQFCQQINQPLLKLTGHTDAITDGDWLFGGEQIITVSWDRTANLFDAENGKILKTLSGHDQELTSCSAHPSQKLLATASRDFTFRLWDFREPIHSVAVFQGHNDSVTSVVFSTLHHIVSGSDDRTVKVWDLRNMRSPISAIRLDSAANRIAICNARNLLAIPLDSRNISIYDLNGNRQTRIPRSTGKCHHRLVSACSWLSDHPTNNLVTCGFDKQIIGWRVHLPPSIATNKT